MIPVADLFLEAAQTLEPLLKAREVRLETRLSAPDARIIGGRKALFGALVSLLENALQVSAPGKSIRLCADSGDDAIRLSVADEGPGIPEDLQARIFEPFFTTMPQGTGLGLPIALGVARAHGGSLSVESTPPRGACFTLALPVQSESSAENGDSS